MPENTHEENTAIFPRERSEWTRIVGRRKSPPDCATHRLASIEVSGAPERTHVSTRPSPFAIARAQETLYERRARRTITISHQSGFRLIGNAENANKINTSYARRDVYVTHRQSPGRRCTRINLLLFLSRITIFIIACRMNERALSDVYLMSRFIRELLNSRDDESLNWTPLH